ncbi:MAG: hypothetical protein JWN13_1531 [Betaproteobacteria bacterium]|jgi:hypothetical protein|nr:hypothetical protein [Betaproteobacteria bacterium]
MAPCKSCTDFVERLRQMVPHDEMHSEGVTRDAEGTGECFKCATCGTEWKRLFPSKLSDRVSPMWQMLS